MNGKKKAGFEESSGFGVWSLEFGVWSLGFGVQSSEIQKFKNILCPVTNCKLRTPNSKLQTVLGWMTGFEPATLRITI